MHEEAPESITQVLYGGTIAFLVLAGLVIFFLVMYMKRKTRNLIEKQQMRSEFSETLFRSQLEIQEQTFKNISQEIHDNIGQALTLAKLNLNTMPPVSDQALEKITTTKELVSKAIVDLRDLSRSLNTDYIVNVGLQKAIEYELGLIKKSSPIQTSMFTEGEPFRAESQQELVLFRIIQEVLNNILKHASAGTIHVHIKYFPDQLELSIADDGKGFEVQEQTGADGAGLGLRNMSNRARLIGAGFSIISGEGKGTTVRITLPQLRF